MDHDRLVNRSIAGSDRVLEIEMTVDQGRGWGEIPRGRS